MSSYALGTHSPESDSSDTYSSDAHSPATSSSDRSWHASALSARHPSAPRSERRAPGPHLRLTRRGRLALTTTVALPLATAIAMVVLNGGTATATDELSTATFSFLQVESGESLWTLAQSIAPNADPRDVISDIVRLNQLDTAVVQPGQRLAIPAKYEH